MAAHTRANRQAATIPVADGFRLPTGVCADRHRSLWCVAKQAGAHTGQRKRRPVLFSRLASGIFSVARGLALGPRRRSPSLGLGRRLLLERSAGGLLRGETRGFGVLGGFSFRGAS